MPYSSGGRPATAFSPTLVACWPSKTQASVPSSAVMTLGAWSAYLAGMCPENMSGGSTTWSSTDTRIRSSMVTVSSLRYEQDRQRGRGAKYLPADVRIVTVRVEAQAGQPVEQEVERYPHLDPGQVHAEADVRPLTPCDARPGGAEDVVVIGVIPPRLVPVRRRQHRHQRRSGGDGHAAQDGVPGGDPGDVEQRRLVAHGFLDCLRDEGSVGADGLQLIGAREQREQQVPGRAVGRLDPRGQQQPQEREDLFVTEPLAVELGLGQVADQVVAGLAAPVVEYPREILLYLLRRRDRRLPSGEDAEYRDGPALEPLVVRAGQPQHAGDHLGRVGEGELPDELGVPPAVETVDEIAGDRVDELGFPARDGLGPEGGGHQGAVAPVLRVVHAEHDVPAHDVAHDQLDDLP